LTGEAPFAASAWMSSFIHIRRPLTGVSSTCRSGCTTTPPAAKSSLHKLNRPHPSHNPGLKPQVLTVQLLDSLPARPA
jgi:hypothetical protein